MAPPARFFSPIPDQGCLSPKISLNEDSRILICRMIYSNFLYLYNFVGLYMALVKAPCFKNLRKNLLCRCRLW